MMKESERHGLECSHRYGYLRPTNAADRVILDALVERGLMTNGSGPVVGDARCGYYWLINDAGRAVLDALPERVLALCEAAEAGENLMIAVGMGWDLDGVMECAEEKYGILQAAFPQENDHD